MSLRQKAFLFLLGVLVPLLSFIYWFVSYLLINDFRALEKTEIEKNIQRVADAYQVTLDDLTLRVNDWGQWNEAYDFVAGTNPGFVESNITGDSIEILDLSYLLYTNKDRGIVFQDYFDRKNKSHSAIPAVTQEVFFNQENLWNHVKGGKEVTSGMLELPEGNALVASRGLTTSDLAAPFNGTVLFSTLFTEEKIQKLSGVTHLELTFVPRKSFADGRAPQDVVNRLRNGQHSYIPDLDDKETLSIGYMAVLDITGDTVGIFVIKDKRETFIKGQESIALFGRWMMFFSIFFILIMLLVIELLVIRKVTGLNKQVRLISAKGQRFRKLVFAGSDEISELAASINEANERTQTQKERAESILNFLRSIGEGVFATDREGNIIFLNRAAEKFVNSKYYQPSESQKFETFFHFIDRRNPLESKSFYPLEKVLHTETVVVFPEKIFLLQGKKEVPVSGSTAPIRNAEGEILGTITVFQDITERHELDKLKDSFISVAAHQLRTPLGSMRWSIELLLGEDLGKIPPAAKEVLSALYQNSERMRMLVNDLLNTSRIEQNRGQETKVLVSLQELLETAMHTLNPEAQKKGLVLREHFPENPFPAILAPEKHLQEAFLNLLSNAIKYNKEGGSVDVTLSRTGDTQVVTFQDTGIGIPEADQSRVFSKFYRASNAVHRDTDSSGLGLFVVKSYIEEAKAKVSLESKENIGTTVTVTFFETKH